MHTYTALAPRAVRNSIEISLQSPCLSLVQKGSNAHCQSEPPIITGLPELF